MRDSRKLPLAAAMLVAFGTSGDVAADNVIVDTCDDSAFPSGTSLRQAISLANDNDNVDLSGLQCSTLTLQQGELTVEQNTLGLLGPVDHELTINAHGDSRAINHLGTGTLYIQYLSVAYGAASGAAESGGCILSSGTLNLLHSTISHCAAGHFGGGAYATNIQAAYMRISGNSANKGAGVAAAEVSIDHGEVTDNHAIADGGGIQGFSKVTLNDSILTMNTAVNGGAAYSADRMYLTRDTISGNAAVTGYGGGVYTRFGGHGIPHLLKITDSTIDHNVSRYRGGGVHGSIVEMVGSTISGNTTGINSEPFSGQGGGVSCYDITMKNSTVVGNTDLRPGSEVGGVQARYATIISSIIANNNGGPYSDLDVLTLTAYTSVIRSSSQPSVSLTVDPRLGPLADHGGGRRTHAVLPGSPVIDLGSNPLNLQYDERGLPRVIGSHPDIGAYERQTNDDQLWYDGFDSS